MIVLREPGEVTTWLVAFWEDTDTLIRKLVPGRFKHVAAFGYCAPARTWLFVDNALQGTRNYLVPDGEHSERTLAQWTSGATVLKIAAKTPASGVWVTPKLLLCTTNVAALIGLRRSALLPDGLYRQLLRENAEIICGRMVQRAKAANA